MGNMHLVKLGRAFLEIRSWTDAAVSQLAAVTRGNIDDCYNRRQRLLAAVRPYNRQRELESLRARATAT